MTDGLQEIRRRWLGDQAEAGASVLDARADIAELLRIIEAQRQAVHNIRSGLLAALQPLKDGDITDVDVVLARIHRNTSVSEALAPV